MSNFTSSLSSTMRSRSAAERIGPPGDNSTQLTPSHLSEYMLLDILANPREVHLDGDVDTVEHTLAANS